ncbi:CoA-binding protein [uncultured Tenacibaculum sp.]|uniref:CoA-binding protein n=1 Tax=uncultured Tenacibaculum sp. TaxID=174713 RepID=UPI00261C479A|nr:CoA-binding protein [uncultured Tenacibaculum sp.]
MKDATLVLGASLKPERYSNKAIKRLIANGLDVLAVGNREGVVENIPIITEKEHFENIDTVTLYLNPKRQKEYYDYIVGLAPRRVIFNPGTENMEFIKMLESQNIESELACTLVLLATNQY